ncbi:hypothetical protein HY251_01810 [bacterium]|nr:hypothetical protein [bacterium]
MRGEIRTLALALVAALVLARAVLAEDATPPERLLGSWESTNTDPRVAFRFTEKKVFMRVGSTVVVGAARYTQDHVSFRAGGKKSYRFELIPTGKLTLASATSGSFVLKRLDATPPELADPVPLTFAAPDKLTKEKIKSVKKDLNLRVERDQATRMKLIALSKAEGTEAEKKTALEAASKEMQSIDADNVAFVGSLCAEVGWIDIGRFGKATSEAAFLLVQHSENLPLMLAALPEIEKDMKAGKGDGQNFAILFDRTRVRIGERQRYGTYVTRGDSGALAMAALEDPKKVDEQRKSIGLVSLREYLDALKEKFGGKDVKIETDEDDDEPK